MNKKKNYLLAFSVSLVMSTLPVMFSSCSDDDDDDDDPILNVTVNGKVGKYSYVDLGLPSGLKWATFNVGATKPEEYGDSFAWGEIIPKNDYHWNNYKWCNGTADSMTKYCTSSHYGTVDYKKELEMADDAAAANWGSSWRIPTSSEIQELIDGCTWKWTNSYGGEVLGTAGRLGISKKNGNVIFLPFTSILPVTRRGYWSSTLQESTVPYSLYFDEYDIAVGYNGSRCVGHLVRAVSD
ncbi:MAG: hypothetical protein MJZ28_09450 [Paludibacteraceae bacterium]|nr:hypothetical protein [Paludibacteraceae bacterium]